MKLSDLTVEYMLAYARFDDVEEVDEQVKAEMSTALTAAIAHCKSITGLTEEELDEHEDITAAAQILAQDFFENRNKFLDYKYKEYNPAVSEILNSHRRVLL